MKSTAFVNWRMLSECVLAEPESTTHLTAYVLEDKVLAIVVNTTQHEMQDLMFDVEPWLKDNAVACPRERYQFLP